MTWHKVVATIELDDGYGYDDINLFPASSVDSRLTQLVAVEVTSTAGIVEGKSKALSIVELSLDDVDPTDTTLIVEGRELFHIPALSEGFFYPLRGEYANGDPDTEAPGDSSRDTEDRGGQFLVPVRSSRARVSVSDPIDLWTETDGEDITVNVYFETAGDQRF